MMNPTEIEKIIQIYHQEVEADDNNAHAHHHLGMYYTQHNDVNRAVTHFNAAIKAAPTFLSAHYNLGILYFKHHNLSMAKLRFLSVLDLDDKHIPAHFYAGVISMHEDALQQAEWHFQSVLTVEPEHVPTLVNLGALALRRDTAQVAISYFTQALMHDNDHAEARRNLAATFLHYDRFENALTHYYELQKKHTLELDDWYNMGVAAMSFGLFSEAENYYQEVLRQMPQHNAALNNLAAVYIRQNRREAAIPLLQAALTNNAFDESSEFMLNVLQKSQAQPKTSHEYVKHLFNNYAINFDQHLQKTLQYTLPQQSFDILKSLFTQKFDYALDLGCGTGLSGVLLREQCEKIIGVDLSVKMLAQARIKRCYEELIENDIVAFLSGHHQQYDLIQALDVLPYFGDLNDLFLVIMPRLQSQGVLLISAEISDEQPWQVQDSMRFCHHPDYLIALAQKHGLTLLRQDVLVARHENDQALSVMHYVFQVEK